MTQDAKAVVAEEIFADSGEMGAFIRSSDWSQTSLGPIENWSFSLKSTLNILLNSCCPTFLVWGQERILFYNDAYSYLWKESQHPILLDQLVDNSGNETWNGIRSRIEQVLTTGQHLHCKNEQFPIHEGQIYDWSYSPIWDETGQIEGVFVTGCRVISLDQQQAVAEREQLLQELTTERAQYISNQKRTEEELRQREEELRLVTNAVPVLIAFVDAEGRYRFNNQTYEEWFGQPTAEVYGRSLSEVLGESAYQVIRPHMEQVLAGQQVTYEGQIPYKDGGTRYIEATYIPRFDSQGNVEGFVALVSDISDRKQAEEALRLSEERARLAIKVGRLGTWHYNPDTNLVNLDERMREIWGEPEDNDTIPLARAMKRIHPDDQTRVADAIGAALNPSSSGTYEIDYRIVWDDGTERWVSANGQVKFEGEGVNRKPVEFIGTALDISDRKQAEEALRQSEERLRLSQQAAGAGLWDWDMVTNQVIWSEEYYWLYGLDLTITPSYENWLASILPEDRERVDKAAREALEDQTNLNVEFRILHPAKEIRWLAAIGQTFYNPEGKPRRMAGIALDITARKLAEAEREQILAREQAAREEAEAANRIKDEFLAVLSHELRSPLNPILGWSKLLRSQKLDANKTSHALEIIERNAQVQAQLINDLLDVSRILQGKLSLNVSPVDLSSTIQAAMETVRLAAEAKSIQLHTIFDSDVNLVLGDSNRLQQVVWNLLSNAIKFTSAGGQVNIRLARLDSQAQLTVSDTGKGIRPDFLPHVFEHFRQESATTTRHFGGLGLGLAIVRYLVELHGGTVQAESPGEGQGATFTVQLPLMPHPTPAQQDARESQPTLGLNDITILVVDDNESTREFVTFLLELWGAKVIPTASASEALTVFTQLKPDILLSDIGMPEMDGYMLIRQVRTLPPEQGGQIPAIALTAYAGEIDYQQAKAAGFQRHVAKPVDPDKLIEVIISLIQPRG